MKEQVTKMDGSHRSKVMEVVVAHLAAHLEEVEAEVEVDMTHAGGRIGHPRTPKGRWGKTWATSL